MGIGWCLLIEKINWTVPGGCLTFLPPGLPVLQAHDMKTLKFIFWSAVIGLIIFGLVDHPVVTILGGIFGLLFQISSGISTLNKRNQMKDLYEHE